VARAAREAIAGALGVPGEERAAATG
jgi:hypothetical protein